MPSDIFLTTLRLTDNCDELKSTKELVSREIHALVSLLKIIWEVHNISACLSFQMNESHIVIHCFLFMSICQDLKVSMMASKIHLYVKS